jgi:2-polyprenyl-3-methyl-5-hydroxy-6-metoxy-1,4-benzoquinol methylase
MGLYECHYCQSKKLNKTCRNLNFYECSDCGLYARYPMPSLKELKKLYSIDYSHDCINSNEIHQISTDRQYKEFAKFIYEILSTKKYINLLDFGAGTGGLIVELERINAEERALKIEGTEISKNAREEANRRLSNRAVAEKININNKYDMVIMMEVIEHLTEPWNDLVAINKVLEDKGCLVITTPNLYGLNSLLTKCKWREQNESTHLIMFGKKSLRDLLYKSGFSRVNFIKYYPAGERGLLHKIKTKVLQFFGLHGGICTIAYKHREES